MTITEHFSYNVSLHVPKNKRSGRLQEEIWPLCKTFSAEKGGGRCVGILRYIMSCSRDMYHMRYLPYLVHLYALYILLVHLVFLSFKLPSLHEWLSFLRGYYWFVPTRAQHIFFRIAPTAGIERVVCKVCGYPRIFHQQSEECTVLDDCRWSHRHICTVSTVAFALCKLCANDARLTQVAACKAKTTVLMAALHYMSWVYGVWYATQSLNCFARHWRSGWCLKCICGISIAFQAPFFRLEL